MGMGNWMVSTRFFGIFKGIYWTLVGILFWWPGLGYHLRIKRKSGFGVLISWIDSEMVNW